MRDRVLRVLPDRLVLAVAVALDAVRRRVPRPVGLALVYHRVAPVAGDPVRELLPALSVADLDVQLRWVTRRYRPVRAAELAGATRARRPGEPIALAVTFDDDSATHREHAAGPLAAYGVPATFFLCGGTLDGPRSYWWEDLQAAHDRGLLDAPLPHLSDAGGDLHALAENLLRLAPAARRDVAAELRRRVGAPPQPGLPRAAVAALAGAGHEIGFHTREHDALDTLDDAGLAAALRDGRAELEAAAGGPLRTIAYPNGRFDARTAPAAAAAGFDAGFTTSHGALGPRTDPRLVPRLEPRSPSLGVFALRLALASWGRR